jgi:hypothetical protein
VIPFTKTSTSFQDRSVSGPSWILPMSLGPMNQQDRRGLPCNGMTRRFRKSLTTCIKVRPSAASSLILSSMGSNSGARDGLALHSFRSSLGPSFGKAVIGLSADDHPVIAPVLPPHATKSGDVGHGWI